MSKKFTFKGGIHPDHNKSQTETVAVEIFNAPERIVIPLIQHIGAPAKPLVKRGDRVLVGQMLGESSGFVSSPVHSSVSGTVQSVGPFPHSNGKQCIAIEIQNDFKDEATTFFPFEKPWREAAPGELVQKIASCGIVGMGGAAFPHM